MLTTIKTSIELDSVDADANGQAIITRKINLKGMSSHTLRGVSVYQDNHRIYFTNAAGNSTSAFVEGVVAPYPMGLTKTEFDTDFSNRLPSGANGMTLFKFKTNNSSLGQLQRDYDQFPSLDIASEETQTIYTPHIYITLNLNSLTTDKAITFSNISLSFYLQFERTTVSFVSAGMGMLREAQDAHLAELSTSGVLTNSATITGNTWPLWKAGGIRPQLMADSFGTSDFFLNYASRDAETMASTTGIRDGIRYARSMSAFNQAFGYDKGIGQAAFPDWFKMNLNEGLVSGPIRDQWPPIKHADNGNVLML